MTVAIYGLVFAECLAMAGRLSDNFGRRQLFGTFGTFGIGVAVFAVAYQSARLRCFASNVAHHPRDARGEERTHNRLVDPRSTNDGSNWTVPGETSDAPLV